MDSVKETPVEPRPDMARTVKVELENEKSRIKDRLMRVLKNGNQCACWVRNTVVDAIEAYNWLLPELGPENLLLFHARFAMEDRIAIEEKVLSSFGKQSKAEDRSGKLLVATQVVEQSLDLDFDFMASDLAPIDLLIQRAGRLCRHARDEQGNPANGPDRRSVPKFLIHTPTIEENPGPNWYKDPFPRAAAVYPHHGQLWLTAQFFAERGHLRVPEDARAMIEGVFGENARNAIPERLMNREVEAEGKEKGEAALASMNALNLRDGYQPTDHWQDDTVTPTRLGEPMVTVRLARWEDNQIVPWSSSKNFAWELSQVNVRRAFIAEMEPTLDSSSIEAALSTMTDQGKWSILLPLREQAESTWEGLALDGKRRQVKVIYSPQIGLLIK